MLSRIGKSSHRRAVVGQHEEDSTNENGKRMRSLQAKRKTGFGWIGCCA